jgi:glycosyltransferase involved in cell wall biosynthesis
VKILLTADPEVPVPPKLYGGIERIVDGLAVALRRRGHQVGLVAHPDSNCPVDFFVAWPEGMSSGRAGHARNALTLLRAASDFRPDVVHSFSRLAYLLPLLTRRTPKIMSYQRHTGGRRNSFAARVGGANMAFTGCSEFIAKMGRRWGGAWSAIPNFVDVNFYRFEPTVPPDAPLVFLSRVERIKGAHTAVAIARESGRRLLIAGNRVEKGEGADYWEREIEPHLGRDGIEYVGPVNDEQKNDLLGRAAAMVVPIGWDEPFGIVFAEALACGTPVISCPRGALPEIVSEGKHGFLIGDVSDGVDAVSRIANLDRAECRRRVEKLFSREVVVTQYENLYQGF